MFVFGSSRKPETWNHQKIERLPQATTAEHPPAPESRLPVPNSETESTAERCSRAFAERPPEAPVRRKQSNMHESRIVDCVLKRTPRSHREYLPNISCWTKDDRSVALDSTYSYIPTQDDIFLLHPGVRAYLHQPPTQSTHDPDFQGKGKSSLIPILVLSLSAWSRQTDHFGVSGTLP